MSRPYLCYVVYFVPSIVEHCLTIEHITSNHCQVHCRAISTVCDGENSRVSERLSN